MRKVYIGKSKDVYERDSNVYILEFKNEMRTSDGRFFLMDNKSQVLNKINSLIFTFLSKKSIPNHYIKKNDDISFVAKAAQPLPLECVVRRFAEGSYLKRNLKINKHHRFEELIFEVFYKDDSLNDPYIERKHGKMFLYNQVKPVSSDSLIKEIDDIKNLDWNQMEKISKNIFLLLEDEFKKKGGTLCDFKIEFGFSQENLIVIDSIEPDSWRLWEGDTKNNLDRDDGYDKEYSKSIQDSIKMKYDLAEKFIEKVFIE